MNTIAIIALTVAVLILMVAETYLSELDDD